MLLPPGSTERTKVQLEKWEPGNTGHSGGLWTWDGTTGWLNRRTDCWGALYRCALACELVWAVFIHEKGMRGIEV